MSGPATRSTARFVDQGMLVGDLVMNTVTGQPPMPKKEGYQFGVASPMFVVVIVVGCCSLAQNSCVTLR